MKRKILLALKSPSSFKEKYVAKLEFPVRLESDVLNRKLCVGEVWIFLQKLRHATEQSHLITKF